MIKPPRKVNISLHAIEFPLVELITVFAGTIKFVYMQNVYSEALLKIYTKCKQTISSLGEHFLRGSCKKILQCLQRYF